MSIVINKNLRQPYLPTYTQIYTSFNQVLIMRLWVNLYRSLDEFSSRQINDILVSPENRI